MASVGIKDAGDFDNGKIIGSQYFQMTIHSSRQQRASSESAYFSAFDYLPNLTIFTHTIGKKILFDSRKKAVGILVENTQIPFTLEVAKEVILSAGAFQSPQLLMVSGVGPKDTLEQYDIPVVYNNPNVGQNMVDHVWFGPSVRVKLETASKWNDDPEYRLSVYEAYREHQEGPLTSNGGDFGAFEKVPDDLRKNFTKAALQDLAAYPDDYPEIEVSKLLRISITRPSRLSLGANLNQVRGRPNLPRQFPFPSTLRRLPIRLDRRSAHGANIPWQHHDPLLRHARRARHQP